MAEALTAALAQATAVEMAANASAVAEVLASKVDDEVNESDDTEYDAYAVESRNFVSSDDDASFEADEDMDLSDLSDLADMDSDFGGSDSE